MAPVLIAKGAEGRVSLDFGDPVAAASTGLAAGTTDLAVDPADTGFVPGQLALLLDGHLTEAVRVVAVGTNLITLAPPGMQYAHGPHCTIVSMQVSGTGIVPRPPYLAAG
jgi:hypothetical protein